VKETLTMSRKERERLVVMDQVAQNTMTLEEAKERMGVCYRQAKRIWARYQARGAEGLVHQSRGRTSNRQLPRKLREEVLRLYRARYGDYGPTLASEALEEHHGLGVNPETLRRWLHGECLLVPRGRHRTHRKRRERRAHFGAMAQMDGSIHAWFEDRADPCCAMMMVDDATGRGMHLMQPQETAEGAFLVLRKWIERHGVPEALYVDRRNVYVADRDPTPEEQRQGSGALTDFGRACWKLGIRLIAANSPQAKGRVERHGGVLQDRLVKELRRLGISGIAEANAMLDGFTERLDAKFAIEPASPVDRHRKAPPREALDEILCWEVQRTVARDWTVSYEGRRYQILRQKHQPRPGNRVTVRKRLDGAVKILWAEQSLAYRPLGSSGHNHLVGSPPPPQGGWLGSSRTDFIRSGKGLG